MRPLIDWIHLIFSDRDINGRILFRVDAGNKRGLSFGHAARCVLLASVVKEIYKADVLFLMRDYSEGTRYVTKSGFSVETIDICKTSDIEESKYITEIFNKFEPTSMIVDLPYSSNHASEYKYYREQGVNLIYLDDSRFNCPDVDIYLNSSIHAPKMGKAMIKKNKANAKMLLGIDYFIFDETLIKECDFDSKDEFNIVITFGGADPTGLTLKVLEVLSVKNWKGIAFYPILGPGFDKSDEVGKIIKEGSNIRWPIKNPKNISPYLNSSDFVICAGGRTMYELLYLKKEFLPIASTKYEAEAIKELNEKGLIDSRLTKWEAKEFILKLDKLIKKKLEISSQ